MTSSPAPAVGRSVLVLAGSVSSVGGLVFGYELGIISGALLQLKPEFHLSALQQEGVVSALLAGALLGSAVGGCVIDRYGRRNAIVLSNVLVLAGSVLLLLGSLPTLLLGRATVGFAMCLSSMSCCIFVSELVTPEHRGFLVPLYEGGITVGILAAYAINYLLSASPGGWKWMFGLVFLPTLIQLLFLGRLPSGPAPHLPPSGPRVTSWYLFGRRDNMRRRTALGLGLVLFQQFTGQPNVLLYASTIFYSAGFHSPAGAALASVGLGCVKVMATGVSMGVSDRVGRRPLLVASCLVMALSLAAIGLLSGRFPVNHLQTFPAAPLSGSTAPPNTLQPPITPGFANWILLLCLMAVVSAYSVVTWLVLSEIFPADVRGRAFAFTCWFNWAANLFISFTFLYTIDVIGLSGVFLLYGGVAVAAAVFFLFLLPETKGRTLEDIDRELSTSRFCWSFGSRMSPLPQYQRVEC